MVATIRTSFDRQLTTLQDDVLHLSEMVISQVLQAVQALTTHDVALAQQVDAHDHDINKLRYQIEENCYTLLALQQPNSGDMRRIVATVSVVTNLERMGDHAAGIARLVVRIEEAGCTVQVPEFERMVELAVANLRDAMTAMATGDRVLARAVVSRDAPIDQLHRLVYERLVQMMTQDTSTIACATMSLWVSHNLERYADRISNICERIIYTITGDLHAPRFEPADQVLITDQAAR